MYDVIIVGAGPGGASAAYFLGQAGQRVLVLEKASLPRYKTCGGGLSSQMLEKFFPFSCESVIESKARAISFAYGNRAVTLPLPDASLAMVMRDRLDAHILAHARAEVRPAVAARSVTERGDRFIVETADGNTFEGRYLIGADGASSVVAKSLGLRRGKTLVAAIEVEAPVSTEILRRFADAPLFIIGEVRLGYLWVFPKSDHLSIGIGALHPRPGELQATLNRIVTRYGISLTGTPWHGHPIPVYTGRERIATSRALLVGDAAGLADPLTGEGIRLAIKSGRLAAQAILAGRPDQYPNLIYRHIGLGQTFAQPLALVFYHLMGLCVALGVLNRLAVEAFLDLLADRAEYPEVILRLIGSLPASLFIRALRQPPGDYHSPILTGTQQMRQ